jgi:hypothetical protein
LRDLPAIDVNQCAVIGQKGELTASIKIRERSNVHGQIVDCGFGCSFCCIFRICRQCFRRQKLAYDQAWAVCKAKMDKAGVPGSLQANERYIRGSNCMKRYGYRI